MAQRTSVVCQVHTAGATLAQSDGTLGEFISEEERRHEASRSERPDGGERRFEARRRAVPSQDEQVGDAGG